MVWVLLLSLPTLVTVPVTASEIVYSHEAQMWPFDFDS